ncbi:histone deacetylase 11 [Phlebotomus argentipes]|uniref:histone deacetylase 11 n=1 Tax=Phlebotomus argentipes TaxID=94469 RepID=UPI002892BF77|nr:histone deacetylase 11 [Phlebotomus argentipes]
MCMRGQETDDEVSDSGEEKLPIVFCKEYNVRFCGIERLVSTNTAAAKGDGIFRRLCEEDFIRESSVHRPRKEISRQELKVVHTKRYLNSLRWSVNVAKITEVPILLLLPIFCVERGYLRPMRFQTAGSLMAGDLALRHGWAINLGGGFHHCSGNRGGGFCAYADISLLIKRLLGSPHGVRRVMIVDLDAHQGNGHERDFMDDERVFIMDMYNASIYPRDKEAKVAIRRKVELHPYTQDREYLHKLRSNLDAALAEFPPDVIIYNAGTDILDGDPLGALSVSPEGVILRDEEVFKRAIRANIPIVMLLSGGYLRSAASVIANSVLNLSAKGLLPRRH